MFWLCSQELLSMPKLYSSASDEVDGSMICAKMQAVVVKLKGPMVVNCWLLCKRLYFQTLIVLRFFSVSFLFALDGDFYTKNGWRCLARLLSKRLERTLKKYNLSAFFSASLNSLNTQQFRKGWSKDTWRTLPFFTSRFPPCSLKHELSKFSPGGLCHRRSGSYSWNTTNRIERMDRSWQVEGGPLDMWNDYPHKCLLRRIIQLNSLWIMTISSVTHGFLLLKRFMPPRIITSEWYPESRFGACFPYICLRIEPYLQGVAILILLSTASPVYQTWLSNLTCCLGLLSTLPPTTRTRKMVVGKRSFRFIDGLIFPDLSFSFNMLQPHFVQRIAVEWDH